MTKNQLIESIANKCGTTKKEADLMLAAFISTVEEQLAAGERIQITGFGTFEVRQYKERTGRNPFTQEQMVIKPSRKPAFIPGKILKSKIGTDNEA